VGPYILDFYSPKHKLAIELDGVHHTKDENQQYDEHRSDYLITHGIKVIRFWNNEVMKNMEGVLLKIAEKIGINLSQEEGITPPNLPLNKGRDTN
jgi:ATP-dependent helicase HrpA